MAEKNKNSSEESKKIQPETAANGGNEKKISVSYVTFFKNYGIILGIIVVFFAILVYSIFISKKSWNNNLKVVVEKVLDEYEPNTWTIGNHVEINNPFCLNASCYEVRSRKSGDVSKAIIIRVATFYGPQAGVFICDDENNVEFAGYSSIHGRVSNQLMFNKSDLRIEYWQSKIPMIIAKE